MSHNMGNNKIIKHPNTTRENKPILHNKNLRIINNSNSDNSSINNYIQSAKYKIRKNDKNEKNPKINIEFIKRNIFQKVKSNLKKYDSSLRKVNIKLINDIIYDERKHIVSRFKDYLFWDENSDFLKRFYRLHESRDRMPRITSYYETYTLIRPIYLKLECFKLLNKNFKRHKRRLEIIEDKLNKNYANNKNQICDNDNEEKNEKLNNLKQSDEFSKIVKSSYIQSENQSEIIFNNHINIYGNNKDFCVKDLRGVNANRDLNNHLNENINEQDMIIYKEKVLNHNRKIHEFDNSVLKDDDFSKKNNIMKIIKFKDVGNKYNIENYQYEENTYSNLKNLNDNKSKNADDIFSLDKNKINNSFSFLESESLFDFDLIKESKLNLKSQNKYQELSTRKPNIAFEKNYFILKNSKMDKNINLNKNQFNLNPEYNLKSEKPGKKAIKIDNNKLTNKNILLKNSEKNKQMLINPKLNLPVKSEEFENSKHSLFVEDYSIIQSEMNYLKDEIFLKNYINIHNNEDHSFMFENLKNNEDDINSKNIKESGHREALISSNGINDKKSVITINSQTQNKKLITNTKNNNSKYNKKDSKERDKEIGNIKKELSINSNINISNKNNACQQGKEVKKIKIPILNLENLKTNNNQNLFSKTEKISYDISSKNPKINKTTETRKQSDPNKKEIKNNLNIYSNKTNSLNNQEYNKIKFNQNNNLNEDTSKNLNEKNSNNNINNMDESVSKSDKEMENKTNQNFKIIENMIKSIKMNNIDNLIKIIESRSKGKNKALTSRESNEGDILILQNIYSRNLNKANLNDNCENYKSSDKKTIVDKQNRNPKEKSKSNIKEKNKFSNNLNFNLNTEANINEFNVEDFEDIDDSKLNKIDINTITESYCTNSTEDLQSKKKDASGKDKYSNQIKANCNYDNKYLSSRNSKDPKNKENREKEILSNFKNGISNRKNSISSAGKKNNCYSSNTKNNKIITSTNKANNNNYENTNLPSNSNNNSSSVYNINLNLNLNLNVKMDKLKNSEKSRNTQNVNIINSINNLNNINNTNKESISNQTRQRNVRSAINNINSQNNPININKNNLLGKENKILIKKVSNEDIYKNIKNSKLASDEIVLDSGPLTDRQEKDYFKFEEYKLKSIVTEESEINYINTDNNINHYPNQFDKINFINKPVIKNINLNEKNQHQNNLNKFLINNGNNINSQLKNNFNKQQNLSRNICPTNNVKLMLRSEEQNINYSNNFKIQNNIGNINYNTNQIFSSNLNSKKQENLNTANNNNYNTSNFTKNIFEGEKKSRNVQNNILINPGKVFSNNSNQIINNNFIDKNTLSSKIRVNQPLTQTSSYGNKNINYNMHFDSSKNINLEKTVDYESEKRKVSDPLLNSNNNCNKNKFNPNTNSKTNNLNSQNPYYSTNTNNKIKINNVLKDDNLKYFNLERGNNITQNKDYMNKYIEKDTRNTMNTHSNDKYTINSLDKNTNNCIINNLNKRDSLANMQNYESLISNQYLNSIHNNNTYDSTMKSQNYPNNESCIKIIQDIEKKFSSNSRNINIQNLVSINDSTNINKIKNPNSLNNNEIYGKYIFINNTTRNNSASNNINHEYNSINRNENCSLIINQQPSKISSDKPKININNTKNNNDYDFNKNNFNLNHNEIVYFIKEKNNNANSNMIIKTNDSEKNNKAYNNIKYMGNPSSNINTSLQENSLINKNRYIDTGNMTNIVYNIDERQNLTSARNKKNINENLIKNVNTVVNPKKYLTIRNEKNLIGVLNNELINFDTNKQKNSICNFLSFY